MTVSIILSIIFCILWLLTEYQRRRLQNSIYAHCNKCNAILKKIDTNKQSTSTDGCSKAPIDTDNFLQYCYKCQTDRRLDRIGKCSFCGTFKWSAEGRKLLTTIPLNKNNTSESFYNNEDKRYEPLKLMVTRRPADLHPGSYAYFDSSRGLLYKTPNKELFVWTMIVAPANLLGTQMVKIGRLSDGRFSVVLTKNNYSEIKLTDSPNKSCFARCSYSPLYLI